MLLLLLRFAKHHLRATQAGKLSAESPFVGINMQAACQTECPFWLPSIVVNEHGSVRVEDVNWMDIFAIWIKATIRKNAHNQFPKIVISAVLVTSQFHAC